jgi:hypothetical protein
LSSLFSSCYLFEFFSSSLNCLLVLTLNLFRYLYKYSLISIIFFLMELGLELRVSYLLSQHSTTWAMTPAIFTFILLNRISHFFWAVRWP